MTDQQRKVDFAPLVHELIGKTMAGKLTWEPTADRQSFVVSVAGKTLFRLRLVSVTDWGEFGQPETTEVPRLDMLDEKGRVIWDIHQNDVPPGELQALYDMARRIGNRVDERLAGALEALGSL